MLKGLLGKIVRKVLLPIAEDVVRKELAKHVGTDLVAKAVSIDIANAVSIDDLIDKARAKAASL